MKKSFILIVLAALVLVTGCESMEEKRVRKESKKEAANVYNMANDSTILHCVTDYIKDENRVVYVYCINDKGDLYTEYGLKYSPGDLYYNTIDYNFYKQILNMVDNPEKGSYAFKFEPNELK